MRIDSRDVTFCTACGKPIRVPPRVSEMSYGYRYRYGCDRCTGLPALARQRHAVRKARRKRQLAK